MCIVIEVKQKKRIEIYEIKNVNTQIKILTQIVSMQENKKKKM